MSCPTMAIEDGPTLAARLSQIGAREVPEALRRWDDRLVAQGSRVAVWA